MIGSLVSLDRTSAVVTERRPVADHRTAVIANLFVDQGFRH